MTVACYCGHVFRTSANKAACPRCGRIASVI